MPSGFPGGMPGGFPGGMPGGFPGGMPGGFSGGMPGGFPGSMPGGMPGNIDYSKILNVSVRLGLTFNFDIFPHVFRYDWFLASCL